MDDVLRQKQIRCGLTIAALLLSLAIYACAWQTSFTRTGGKYPPYKGEVQVYYEPPVGLVYEEIGLVSAETNEVHLKSKVIQALQRRAAAEGANAIILTDLKANGDRLSPPSYGTPPGLYAEPNDGRTEQFRPQYNYVPKIVTLGARAIRIEPLR